MKRKNLRLSLASLIVFLLVGVMGVTAALTAFNGNTVISPNSSTNSAVKAGKFEEDLSSIINPEKASKAKTPSKTDKVGLIIQMDDNALIDIYLANPNGYATFSDYLASTEGKNAAENLINKQNALFNKIARQADVKLKYNYVNVINGFSVEITYGDRTTIDAIAKKANVLSTSIASTYEAPEPQAVFNEVLKEDTGIFKSKAARAEGLAGQGMVVAVLDTGLDWEHIAFDPNHPLFDLENQITNETLALTEDIIEDKLPSLAMANYKVSNITVSDVYINEKIPYAFDYSDNDTETSSHVENNHGTHVAGIIAGHSDDPYRHKDNGKVYLKEVDADGVPTGKYYQRNYLGNAHWERVYLEGAKDADFVKINRPKTEEEEEKYITGITGVAPQAQLVICKVFPDGTEAREDAIMAALNDCVALGVDVINMSLGSNNGFQDESELARANYATYERVGRAGISLIVAAGNEFSSSFQSHAGLNLISNPESGAITSPASYETSFAVASISGVESRYITAVDANNNELATAYYYDSSRENSTSYDFMKEIFAEVKKRGLESEYLQADGTLRIPYVTIPGVGKPVHYAGKQVRNKIALVARGELNFEEKLQNAEEFGALACIIYNNAAGIIRMQVGDNVNIPSCSMTMDEAQNVRGKDAWFIIDNNAKAGPFISEYSSWGPLPNLALKPDITAHGGEIYSSIPGDDTAYDVMSGTSMACPNMAGVVALLRQYMQSKEVDGKFVRPEAGDTNTIAKKFDILKNGAIDNNLMEARIYQILMSTATVTRNEEGNPYSPRKQGAGLADIERARTSNQYLVVKDGNTELERTKIELYDDTCREKADEFKLEFYARNVGNTVQKYNISSHVFTEGISSDGKTVNEKAHMLTAKDQVITLMVNGVKKPIDSEIEVPANGGEVKITYTVKLGKEDIEWLEQFPNGMYVEGFVYLKNKDDKGIDLNVPFLAFYGDWMDAPIMDYDVYQTDADLKDDNIDEDDKRYSNALPLRMVGLVADNGSEFLFGMGENNFNIVDGFEDYLAPAEADRCALSYDTNSGMYQLYCFSGFLRAAKRMFWQITDATTGDILIQDVYFCSKKSTALSANGAWVEISVGTLGLDVVNNHKYNISMYPVLDWKPERYEYKKADGSWDIQKNIEEIIKDNEAYNAAHPGNERNYWWSTSFWADTEAPYIQDTAVRIVKDSMGNATYYLDLTLFDNHYLAAMGLYYFDEDLDKFVSAFDEDGGMRPFNVGRNTATTVSFNITSLWRSQIHDALRMLVDDDESNDDLGLKLSEFQVSLYDYAMNRSFYTIDLAALFEPASMISFGDIGNYRTATNVSDPNDKIKVLTSYNNQLPTGSERITEINLVPGQEFDVMKSVITNPINAWREDLIFETNARPEILALDAEHGKIYAIGAGDCEVTVTSALTGQSATLKVHILSSEKLAKYGISEADANRYKSTQTLSDVVFKENGIILNAGEEYEVEIEYDPWYIEELVDMSEYYIMWTSSRERIATVIPDANNPLKAIVKANRGTDYEGEYVENITGSVEITAEVYKIVEGGGTLLYVDQATGKEVRGNKIGAADTFYSGVKEEFVVEANALTKYNGTPENGRVVIPSNLNIFSIAPSLFYGRNDITEIVFPEGLETIGYSSCANMTKLRKVVFPSTLLKIDRYAFTAKYGAAASGPSTELSILDFTKCKKPIQVASYAFANQRYIGVDFDSPDTQIVNLGENAVTDTTDNKIKLLENDPFDTKMIKTVGDYSFYDMEFVSKIDLSGLRSAQTASFYGLGASLRKYFDAEGNFDTNFNDDSKERMYAELIMGEHTTGGIATFAAAGIKSITIPSRRITPLMFQGIVEDGIDENGEEASIPIYTGALKTITFTADNLVIDESAFYGSSVENVIFEGNVASIGAAAFYDSNIKTITWGTNVECKKIGASAFYGCDNLTEFTLPDGLEILGSSVFYECKNLQKLIFSKDCKLFTEVNGKQVTGIEGAPFNGCKSLTEFEVAPDSQYIKQENGALYTKDGSKLLIVPSNSTKTNVSDYLTDNVEVIGAYAFIENENLTTVDLGDPKYADLKLENGAFIWCRNITSAALPANLSEVPGELFYDCELLAEITIGDKITKIGDYAFLGTAISEIAINLDSKITSIGEGAFAYCYNLTSFTFPRALTTISATMFFRCTSLVTLNETTRITRIEDQAFTFTGITAAEFRRCEYIGYGAFAACRYLESVYFPAVKYVGELAFYGANESDFAEEGEEVVENIAATSLTKVEIGSNGGADTTIGQQAFYNQTKLTSITLPTVTAIGDAAFYSCSNLTTVTMPVVKRIGGYAFANTAVVLTSSNGLPGTLEYMNPTAFAESNVSNYYVGSDSDYFSEFGSDGGVLYRKINGKDDEYELVSMPIYYSNEVEYTVLPGTKRIAEYAFYLSEYIVKVNIPESIETIGDSAFFYSSVKLFNIQTLNAPELEANYMGVETEYNDVYFWQIYNNFFRPFSFSNGMFGEFYKYNPIRLKQETDEVVYMPAMSIVDAETVPLQNTSYLGGDYSGLYLLNYGILLSIPSNAKGFDSFIWSNYFDTVSLTKELCEQATKDVMELIKKLPDPSKITLAHSSNLENARIRYDNLSSFEQKAFVANEGLLEKLEKCEKSYAELTASEADKAQAVIDLIAALPMPEKITLDDKADVEAARAAYNKLSEDNREIVKANVLAMQKLTACEDKIKELEANNGNGGKKKGCGSCGTVAFGGNGGTGLMIGLAAVMLVCMLVVLLRKKKVTDK